MSNGKYKDRMEVNVKNPSMFVSEASKMPLDKKFTTLVKEIPAQLPKSMDGEALIENTQKITLFSTVLFFVSLALQLLLKTYKGESTSIIL